MKIGSWVKRTKGLLLGVGLALAVGLIPHTAQAVVGGSPEELSNGGGNLQGNQLYFGKYDGGNNIGIGELKWYVVDTESPDKDGQPAITLWTGETYVAEREYDLEGHKNWSGSALCGWLNNEFLANAFNNVEKETISLYGDTEDGVHETIQIDQKILLPSVAEMGFYNNTGEWKINKTTRGFFAGYSLRSPGNNWSRAAFVYGDGFVDPGGDDVTRSGWAIRPVLKLPLDSLLFTSSATNGSSAKSEVEVGDGLQKVISVEDSERSNTPLKLTVIDESQTQPTVSNFTTAGNQVSFDYTDAPTGTNQYLSVLLKDKTSGKIAYYGKLADNSTMDNGTASFATTALADGDYTVQIFSEQANGEKETDVACPPVEEELTIKNGLPEDSFGSVIAFDGYEWYVIGSAENDALRVLLKSEVNKDGIGTRAYAENIDFGVNNQYGASVLKNAMDYSVKMIENSREKTLIQGRTLIGGSSNYEGFPSTNYPTGIAGPTVTDAKFWPLSTAEAIAIGGDPDGVGSDIAKYQPSYWLRSPGDDEYKAAFVHDSGNVNPLGYGGMGYQVAVRPAFDLPLDSLLLTSSASEASSEVKGSGEAASADWKDLSDLLPEDGEIPKYTMITDAIKLDITDDDQTFYVDQTDREITICYTNATHEPAENKNRGSYVSNYLSALLTIGGETHYLKASPITEEVGEAVFKLPEGITAGEYTLKVFNEEINETTNNYNYTDFASEPVELKVKVGEFATVESIQPTGSANVPYPVTTNEIKITFNQAMDTDHEDGVVQLSDGTNTFNAAFARWTPDGRTAIYQLADENLPLSHDQIYQYTIRDFVTSERMPMKEADTRFSFKTYRKESTPNVTIDYAGERLIGFEPGAYHTIEINNTVVSERWLGPGGFQLLEEFWFGKEVSIYRNGVAGQSDPSDAQTFTLPERQKAPQVTVTPETKAGASDGQMTVTSPADNVQYKTAGSDWEDYSAPLTGIRENDTIQFRTGHVEDQGSFASGKFRSLVVEKKMVSRPSVVSMTPTTDAPVSDELTICFDRDMDAAAGSVELAVEGTDLWQPLSPKVNPWSGNRAYTVTYANLLAGQRYQLRIKGFTDATYGLSMVEDTENRLVVAGKPVVTSVTPNDTAKVPIETTELKVQFDVPMATAGTVTLTSENNEPITANFDQWTDEQTAVYTISGLQYGTKYTYNIRDFISKKGTKLDETADDHFTTFAKEDASSIVLDYETEELSGFVAGEDYLLNGGEPFTATGNVNITQHIAADQVSELRLVKLGIAGESVDSDPYIIRLPKRPAAPSDLTRIPATNATTADGVITGVDDTMEYRLNDEPDWKSVSGTTITGLTKGTVVHVRQAASNQAENFYGATTSLTMTDYPVVTSVIPTTNAPNSGELTVTFSKPMDQGKTGLVQLEDLSLSGGSWDETGTVFTTSYSDLIDEKTYEVMISGFTDTEGYTMKEDKNFSVTIGDNTPPRVIKVTPAGTDVQVTTNQLVLTFNEAVQVGSGTVTAEGLTLSNPQGSDGNRVVTYQLSGLERNKTYTVNINGFKDVSENEMSSYAYEFSTEKSRYTLVFDKNAEEATGEMSPQVLTYDSGATKLAKNTFQRTGYHFNGWATDDGQTFTDEQAVENLTAEHEATITLKAQWKANSYQGNFDNNGGEGVIASQPATYGESFTLPTGGFTRSGYRLVGWSTTQTPTEESRYDLGAVIPWNFDNDMTFYAVWQAEYTVRFNPDNGEGVTEQVVLAGEAVTPPANPTKAYHSFDGWLWNGSLYDFSQPVTQNMELVAQWNKVYHTVTFEANGGVGGTKQTVMSGTTVTEPEVIRYGYTFSGWSTDAAGGSYWNPATPITEDVTLYAQWSLIPRYTLIFETNGGQGLASLTDFENQVIDLTNHQPTKPGFTFAGWYLDAALTKPVNQVTLTSDQTIYAKWQEVTEENHYTLSFETNGGSAVAEGIYEENELVSLTGKTTARAGYTFSGWYETAALTGTPVTQVQMNENKVVYAKWTANDYQVNIDLNGGSGSEVPLTATYDQEFIFPTGEHYTQEGQHLLGWQLGDTRYEAGAVLPQWTYTSNQTMTAIWAKNSYAIQFETRGGSEVATQYIPHGERLIEPSAPSKADHTFSHWTLSAHGAGEPVDFETYLAVEDTTLYASWQSTFFHLVRYESRDNTKVASVQVRQGEYAPIPEPWEWVGYTFNGWKTETGEAIESKLIEANTIFYADWIPVKYQLTLRNGDMEESREYDRDNLQLLPIPEARSGYRFDGWLEIAQRRAIGEIHTDTSKLIGNVVLEAQWTPIDYQVLFDSAGGQNVDPINFTVKTEVSELPTPIRKGYLFQGWYNEAGKKVTSIPVGTVGNQLLTARWLADKTELATLVDEELAKNRVENSYTTNSWQNYEKAMIQAQLILAKEDATAQEVYEARIGLQAAIDNLTERQGGLAVPTGNNLGSGLRLNNKGITTKESYQKHPNLLQTGEEKSPLFLFLGLTLICFVIPAWRKKQDPL